MNSCRRDEARWIESDNDSPLLRGALPLGVRTLFGVSVPHATVVAAGAAVVVANRGAVDARWRFICMHGSLVAPDSQREFGRLGLSPPCRRLARPAEQWRMHGQEAFLVHADSARPRSVACVRHSRSL